MPSAWNNSRDRRLLLAMFALNKSTIKLDYIKLAELCGGNTKSGADHRFRVLKAEMQQLLDDLNSGTAPPVAPVTPRKNKANGKRPMMPDSVLGPKKGAGVKKSKAKGKGRVKKEVVSEDESGSMPEEEAGDEMEVEKRGDGYGPGEEEVEDNVFEEDEDSEALFGF